MQRIHPREISPLLVGLALSIVLSLAGCAASRPLSELTVRDAVARYTANGTERLYASTTATGPRTDRTATAGWDDVLAEVGALANAGDAAREPSYFTLGMVPQERSGSPETQPTSAGGTGVPDGYWRESTWHQMGYEFKSLVAHDFWRGFKTSFWDLENALVLTATMGASVAIRETGVDNTIRNRVHGHRQLGDADETLQILGNPGTHFAGAGVLWLTSTLMKDEKQHEVAKTLTQALAVNGVTTMALKAATNTRAPDGESLAWPSGHTSSAFTVAAVLNEYYGPWVGVPSLVLAGLAGYQRIDSRVHDFSDVVFGAMLGYVVGTSIARDEKAQFPELFGMKVVPFTDVETGASGLALMKSW